jgi:hypothetical protein
MMECRSTDLTFVVRITCAVPCDVAAALVPSVRGRARARGAPRDRPLAKPALNRCRIAAEADRRGA